MERKKVAVIGAGIGGLLACKYCLSKGFHTTVFESRSHIGGVWSKTIKSTKLQTPKMDFQFMDFPWPASVTEDFPNQQQVLEYLKSYADHFDLIRHIRFNSKVMGISYKSDEEDMKGWSLWGGTGEAFNSKAKWNIIVQDNQTVPLSKSEVFEADFVILCVGRFSDVPNIPEFPSGRGPEVFEGKVLHSMDYTNIGAQCVEGKRVAVVGLQKSALDIAVECCTTNGVENPCTVVYRTPRWNVPDYFPWGVPLSYLYHTRFSELLVHKPGEGFLLGLLASLLSPLRWGLSKFVESYIKSKLQLAKYGMVPEHSFNQETDSCLTSIVPKDFYKKVDEGSIKLKRASRGFSFTKDGILVNGDSEPIKIDMAILATGFRGVDKLMDIFVSPTFQQLIAGSPDSIVPLYRECINPRIPQLAIIGFSESVANLYTMELRCRWVTELLDGKFKLPGIKEMKEDVEKWDAYMKQYSGRYYRRSCISTLLIWANDQLCNDMGWNPKRKKGFIADLFEPYGPLDYAHP